MAKAFTHEEYIFTLNTFAAEIAMHDEARTDVYEVLMTLSSPPRITLNLMALLQGTGQASKEWNAAAVGCWPRQSLCLGRQRKRWNCRERRTRKVFLEDVVRASNSLMRLVPSFSLYLLEPITCLVTLVLMKGLFTKGHCLCIGRF
jgi:hypothetical protein